MPFVADYWCRGCGNIWEDITDNSKSSPDACPMCKSSEGIERLLGGVITKCHDPAVRSEVLKKRSLDHSMRTAKNNIDRLVSSGKVKPMN